MKKWMILFLIPFTLLMGMSKATNTEIPKPHVVIPLGPPGAGKGTHATP